MYRVAPEKLELMPGLEALKGKEIWGMESFNKGILFATADDGLFHYENFVLKKWNHGDFPFYFVYFSIDLRKS